MDFAVVASPRNGLRWHAYSGSRHSRRLWTDIIHLISCPAPEEQNHPQIWSLFFLRDHGATLAHYGNSLDACLHIDISNDSQHADAFIDAAAALLGGASLPRLRRPIACNCFLLHKFRKVSPGSGPSHELCYDADGRNFYSAWAKTQRRRYQLSPGNRYWHPQRLLAKSAKSFKNENDFWIFCINAHMLIC